MDLRFENAISRDTQLHHKLGQSRVVQRASEWLVVVLTIPIAEELLERTHPTIRRLLKVDLNTFGRQQSLRLSEDIAKCRV